MSTGGIQLARLRGLHRSAVALAGLVVPLIAGTVALPTPGPVDRPEPLELREVAS